MTDDGGRVARQRDVEVPARLRTARAWRKLGGRLGGQRPVEQISRGT
jgi:hypothetical protein